VGNPGRTGHTRGADGARRRYRCQVVPGIGGPWSERIGSAASAAVRGTRRVALIGSGPLTERSVDRAVLSLRGGDGI